MVSHSISIIFFSLILVLLILFDEIEGPTFVSKVGFVKQGNDE